MAYFSAVILWLAIAPIREGWKQKNLNMRCNKRWHCDMYNQSDNTIQTWKTNIRRKLKIPSYGDIKSHLLVNFAK